jgi:hypothetical protein
MEKNWKRFAKVIDDSLMISDGPLYPKHIQSIQKIPICLEYWFDKIFF